MYILYLTIHRGINAEKAMLCNGKPRDQRPENYLFDLGQVMTSVILNS